MRITRGELRRLVKEEARRLVESPAVDDHRRSASEVAADEVINALHTVMGDCVQETLLRLGSKDPGSITTHKLSKAITNHPEFENWVRRFAADLVKASQSQLRNS